MLSYMFNTRNDIFLKKNRLIVVTGADYTHAKSLLNLLNSLKKYEPDALVLVWDLGLLQKDVEYIKVNFKNIELFKFKFSDYPEYFNIKINAGSYAWKPTFIWLSYQFLKTKDLIEDTTLIYLDAGNLLIGNLKRVQRLVIKEEVFTPYSKGRIREYTHPNTIDKMAFLTDFGNPRNCNAALVGFKLKSMRALNLITTWKNLALDKDCIAPIGVEKITHRYDQSILSILCCKLGFNKKRYYRNLKPAINILLHQDAD